MHVASHKAIHNFCQRHPAARSSFDMWYRVAKKATWVNYAQIKQTFNSADWVAPFAVFDIGGNQYRLIAEINFRSRVMFIRHILTHKDYSKGDWKK